MIRALRFSLPLLLVALAPAASTTQGPASIWSVPAHSGAVHALAFSPDGQLVATAGADHRVKLWRASDGVLVRVLAIYTDEASAVDFSPDGTLVASGSLGDVLTVSQVATGATVCSQPLTGFVRDLSFAPAGNRLAVALGYFSNELELFDPGSCELTAILKPNDGTIWTTAYSPDGAWLASGGADGDTAVLHASGGLVFDFGLHDGDVSAVAFAPNGTRVASSGLFDHHVYVWSLPAGNLALDLATPGEFLHGLDMATSGGLIAACGEVWPSHGTIHLWSAVDGHPLASYATGLGPNVGCLEFAPDGQTFAFGRSDGVLALAAVPGAFVPVGAGLAGGAGLPQLNGSGDATAGSATGFTLAVSHAPPLALGLLFAGTTLGSQPLLGGTLYPVPVLIQVVVPVDAAGGFALGAKIPAGVPATTSFVLQAWFPDGQAAAGASATNGLLFSVK
jgi:roadblock/LC7 domain-containing protein